jgi:hypothetical protein
VPGSVSVWAIWIVKKRSSAYLQRDWNAHEFSAQIFSKEQTFYRHTYQTSRIKKFTSEKARSLITRDKGIQGQVAHYQHITGTKFRLNTSSSEF